MIQYVKIKGKEHPFYFGWRELLTIAGSLGVQTHELNSVFSVDFDAYINFLAMASKKGVKEQGNGIPLTAEHIEKAMDEEPDLFVAFGEAYQKSAVFAKFLEQAGGKAGSP